MTKLGRIAKFLEEIPSKLPLTKGQLLPPVAAFSRKDMVAYGGGLLLWFGIGVAGVMAYHLAAGVFYLALGPVAYLTYVYLACTKCPYYGVRCYMGGGQCAARLFRARQGDYTLFEDLLVPALWIGVSAYPVPWLFYYQAWALLALYLLCTLSWQIFHKRSICGKCRNVRCALNPRFVGRQQRLS